MLWSITGAVAGVEAIVDSWKGADEGAIVGQRSCR